MKKFVRVIEIILCVLIVICGILLTCGYLWAKDQTIEIVNNIKEFVNQPLPIVGVSILTLSIAGYEIFVKTKYGKGAITRLENEYKEKMDQLEKKSLDIDKVKDELETKLDDYAKENEFLKECVIELCGYSRNYKAHDLVEKIKGGIEYGETKDSEITEE